MKPIPQIENGKSPLALLNIVNIPMFPSETPYGNLLLKSMNIVRRIDRVNLEIQRVYGTYVHPDKEDVENVLQDVVEHQFYAEQVVYWLRKTSDELISLAYVFDYRRRTSKWPDALEIDSIFGVLRRRKAEGETDDLFDLFSPYKGFLTTLNDVSNAFKHSFINTDINLAGSEYPVVYALGLKRNKLDAQPQLYDVSFEEMVVTFSRFYQHVMKTASRWAAEGVTISK